VWLFVIGEFVGDRQNFPMSRYEIDSIRGIGPRKINASRCERFQHFHTIAAIDDTVFDLDFFHITEDDRSVVSEMATANGGDQCEAGEECKQKPKPLFARKTRAG
jgi:hypothetical protein